MEFKTVSTPFNNPLSKHFRRPAIYLRLPSSGKFYPDGSIDLTTTNEIPVYPMTVKDELTLKTPDALLNGIGMVEVVKSCCPSIIDPWCMPSVDVDAVFIAIRLASYGPSMDFTSKCLNCDAKNQHAIDLQVLLDRLHPANYSEIVTIDQLKFKFKPQNYKNINQTNIITYEEQKLVTSIIANESLPEEEKIRRFNESFNKLKNMNITVLTSSIDSITTEEGIVVTDQNMLNEFLENCSRQVYEEIKLHIQKLIDQNKLEKLTLPCDECQKNYETELTFDHSNFFG
jgi:hypothetical protein